MKVHVELTETEYSMLKAYAAARRKYEVGKGYRIKNAIADAFSIGMDAISNTIIVDKNGNSVNWKNEERVYGVFTKKENCHDNLLKIFETEKQAVDYITQNRELYKRDLFYREMKTDDVLYYRNEYDKR